MAPDQVNVLKTMNAKSIINTMANAKNSVTISHPWILIRALLIPNIGVQFLDKYQLQVTQRLRTELQKYHFELVCNIPGRVNSIIWSGNIPQLQIKKQ